MFTKKEKEKEKEKEKKEKRKKKNQNQNQKKKKNQALHFKIVIKSKAGWKNKNSGGFRVIIH